MNRHVAIPGGGPASGLSARSDVESLAHLHAQGLAHRDIKLGNVIFVHGQPKLADIGPVTGAGDSRSFVGTEGFAPLEGPGSVQAEDYALGLDARRLPVWNLGEVRARLQELGLDWELARRSDRP